MNSLRILTCIDLPERLFVIALVPEGGRHPDRMALFSTCDAEGSRRTPVFSSMAKAVAFLSHGQELGHQVPLEYIFPAAGSRFAAEFPDYAPSLDPLAEEFFADASGRRPV